MLHNTYYKNKYGFGIIEVVIAVGLMTVIISGASILEKNAMKSSVINAERTQAYNLVREGIEGYRAIRDTSWIDNRPETVWNTGFIPGTGNIYSLRMDCAQGNSNCNWNLYPVSDGETITQDNREFKRKITFESINDTPISAQIAQIVQPEYTLPEGATWDNFMTKIKVDVNWNSYGRDYLVSASEILTDWKPVY